MAMNPTLKERPADEMGQIFTTIAVTNATDLDNADVGLIRSTEIRSATVENVLVDTGATYLCLPADVVARLGLRVLREVSLRTATGAVNTRMFRGAWVDLLGRDTVADCVALAPGSQAVLGAIPMRSMGIEPDLATRTLRLLPDSGPDGYIMA
jgi:predicted aspartyl protease